MDQIDAYVGTYPDYEYHIVCPLHTYYHDDRCFNSPAGRIDLVVQPRYDELWEDDEKAQGPLEYEFRLIFSSDLGNVNQYNEILDKLTQTWWSDDFILNQAFADTNIENQTGRRVHSGTLRDENSYKIEVTITDDYSAFNFKAQMTFIPLMTTWFEPIRGENNFGNYDETPSFGRRLMASTPEQEVHWYPAGQPIEF